MSSIPSVVQEALLETAWASNDSGKPCLTPGCIGCFPL